MIHKMTIDPYNVTEDKFIAYILHLRGYVGAKHQLSLAQIYLHGIKRLRVACTKKQMGIKNIEYISTLSEDKQNDFCNFMDHKHWKATKDELDLWHLGL